jgi:hypothetical protein
MAHGAKGRCWEVRKVRINRARKLRGNKIEVEKMRR